MFKKLNNKNTNYDKLGENYMKLKNKYYSKHQDKSKRELYNQIDFLLKNKRLLDVGCGFGRDLSYFQKKGAIVYGIDKSKKMILLTRKNYPYIKNLYIQTFEKTDFKDNFFDIIISEWALQYASNINIVIKELYRILKSKGILIFLVTHPISDFLLKNKKCYHKMDIIRKGLFNDKIILKYPTHTFSEYFNDFVLKNFKILSFYEDTNNVPEFFILKLKKI
jgi:ubiquinone/menaquinone biosynthesis C-methylase UbiE